MVEFDFFEFLENLSPSQRDRVFRIFQKYPRLQLPVIQLLEEKQDLVRFGGQDSAKKIILQERQAIENILNEGGQND